MEQKRNIIQRILNFGQLKHVGFETELMKAFRASLKKSGVNSTLAKITPWQLYRYYWSVVDWRNAIDDAENVYTPDKFDLIEIFHDIVDDYAVFSAMQQRTAKVINSKIMFLNEDGSENEEIKSFFLNADGTQKAWFRKWLKIAQDVQYYGFEVAEIGTFIEGDFVDIGLYKSMNKIPEENLIPPFRLIKKDAQGGIVDNNIIDMDFGEFSPKLVPMGNEKDLGLLNKAVPFVIWKYIFANWRQHAEIFGQPFREGRTDIYDNDRVKQMQKMFEEMVSSTYGIFHPEDEVKFIETSKSDAYNIYDKLIERCDYAITKIFLSQTGTTDEKSFVGAAQTHERTFSDIINSDRLDISEYFSGVLVPKLKKLGVIDQGLKISLTWINEEHLSLKDWSEIIKDLSINYTIPAEEITKRFDIDAEEKEIGFDAPKEATPEKIADIMNKTQIYYRKLWHEQ